MRTDRMGAMLLMFLLAVAVVTVTGCPSEPPPIEAPTNIEPPEEIEATDTEATETDEEATEADEEATEEATDEPTEEATEEAAADTGEWVTTDSGLKIQDVEIGDGAEAVAGKTVAVLYRGTTDDGEVFDESAKHGGDPIDFPLGAGAVIEGWDEGIAGMKVGGKRNLEIPADLAYGSGGHPLAGQTLHFECELVEVK